jgi:hypothetical protein
MVARRIRGEAFDILECSRDVAEERPGLLIEN